MPLILIDIGERTGNDAETKGNRTRKCIQKPDFTEQTNDTLTAFAVHVCMAFACQNPVFVRCSIE